MRETGAPPRRVRWFDVLIPQAISLGVSLVATVAVFAVWAAHDFQAAIGRLHAILQGFVGLNLFLDFSNLLLLGACLWVLLRITDPALPARFGAMTRDTLAIGIAAGLAIVLYSLAWEYLSDTYLHTDLSRDTLSLPVIPRHTDQLLLGIFTAAILAPLAEEAYFRGVVLGWIARHAGNWPAIFGSALLFGFLHMKLFTPGGLNGLMLTAELVVMGSVLGWVAVRTGSLWASFLLHATNNLCAVLASVFLAH